MPEQSPSVEGASPSEPQADVRALAFTAPELAGVRALVRERAATVGMDPGRTSDLVLAVNELASNSIRHAGGGGELRIWTTADRLVCEVKDSGHIQDARAERIRPDAAAGGSLGLWLVHELCEGVQIRSSSAGTTIRVYMQLTQPARSPS
jgi:anti-sigma regulatory factor (Ser/Thr protein kinase)